MIGASNREDMIDPAILRPGRLDVKIRSNGRTPRRLATSSRSTSLTTCSIHPDDLAEHGGHRGHRRSHDPDHGRADVHRVEENRFLEVTYANGDKETLYFKDFNSGAMIQNIVDRAKKMAIKDLLTTTNAACGSSTWWRPCR